MIDVHVHILPGLDDGPPAMGLAVELVRGLNQLGFTHLCATPHQRPGYWMPSAEAVEQARAALVQQLELEQLPVTLSTGAENHLDGSMVELLLQGRARTLGPSRSLLLELSELAAPNGLESLLFELQLSGFTTVFAHPERFSYLTWRQWADLRERGALLQISLTSLGGRFGMAAARQATELLKRGICDLVASDAHHPKDLAWIREAFQRLRKLVDEATMHRLTQTIPARVLQGAPTAQQGIRP